MVVIPSTTAEPHSVTQRISGLESLPGFGDETDELDVDKTNPWDRSNEAHLFLSARSTLRIRKTLTTPVSRKNPCLQGPLGFHARCFGPMSRRFS